MTIQQTTPTPTEDTAGRPARRHPRTVHRRSHYDVDGTWIALCGWRSTRPRAATLTADTVPCPACEAADALWFGSDRP